MDEKNKLPIISRESLKKIDDRPARVIPVPAWGGSVVVREPSVRTETTIIRSATKPVDGGKKDETELDNEDFGVKMILAGFVDPALTSEDEEMIKSWGAATIDYLVTQIRNRKKNEISKT